MSLQEKAFPIQLGENIGKTEVKVLSFHTLLRLCSTATAPPPNSSLRCFSSRRRTNSPPAFAAQVPLADFGVTFAASRAKFPRSFCCSTPNNNNQHPIHPNQRFTFRFSLLFLLLGLLIRESIRQTLRPLSVSGLLSLVQFKESKKGDMKLLGMDFSCAFGSLRDGQLPDKDCLLPLISKLLGYCIVAASTTVKLPQILKILRHQSVRGLSVVAFELEVVGYTIALAYCLHKGLPFSAYGELVFLLIQAIILVAIIYYYSPPMGFKTWSRALLYCAVAPTILAGQIGPILFEALYASQHAIFFFARVPQIWQNYSNRSTGELSFLTSLMNFGGSMVRVFTSIQEKAPTSVIMGSVMGIVMNGTILSQIVVYQKPELKKEEKKE